MAANNRTTTFAYPDCREQSTGPCRLETSSADACTRQYQNQTDIYYAIELCKCTNGYYNRSSECHVDCYHYSATSTNYISISVESALVSIRCQSLSLAVLGDSLFRASFSSASASRASADASRSSKAGTTSTAAASHGASVTLGAPQTTTSWADRPLATASAQRGCADGVRAMGRRGLLVYLTVVLLLLLALDN